MWASLLVLAQADPAALVERLGSDDIEDRERAEAALARLGPAAEAALDGAARGEDPEAAARARRLLRGIMAPHRREIARVVAHIGAHADLAARRGRRWEAANLSLALTLIDPAHAFASPNAWGNPSARFDARVSKHPSGERWAELRDGIQALIEKSYARDCSVCVKERLGRVRVGLIVENARARDVLDQLESVGDFKIHVEGEEEIFDRAVTLDTRGLTLGEAVERVLGSFGLTPVVGEEGVVTAVARAVR